ncbi:ABC transporter ATP-binding protein [Tessaracoccus caeni]|uniref:ABC transporter ATP-binding protein n=1 Tax=Tessaracoccus caeni TaxID=3031239 RepID=UPI0029E7FEB2|nr:ABC transporter ATP-binding protein [Tessaracoccus caeni]
MTELLPEQTADGGGAAEAKADKLAAKAQAKAAKKQVRADRKATRHLPTPVGNPEFDGPIVQLTDVSRIFPGQPPVQALRNVDLVVDKGDYIAIVGPSGSGKSTMLNTLGLLDRPSSGSYHFEGIEVSALSDDERSALRAQAIGFVFQSFHLLPTRSVLENVVLATAYAGVPRDERHDRAQAALERVGLGHRLDFRPGTLSGGERQRVAIARAVSTSPRLLFADEPTGNLDQRNSGEVMRLFDELGAEGLTIVVITHDMAVAASAKRRVRISDGQLSEVA